MQSAKKLMAFSQSLAASNFLLTPTTINFQAIDTSGWASVLYNKIKGIISKNVINWLKTKGARKKVKRLAKRHENKKPRLRVLIDAYIKALPHILRVYKSDKQKHKTSLGKLLWPFQSYLRDVKQNFSQGWTCGSFVEKLVNDPQIKQFLQEFNSWFKSFLGSYSPVKNSPEGVQGIIMCFDRKYSNSSLHTSLVENAILNADLIDIEKTYINEFGEYKHAENAMQTLHKIMQIANTLSSPIIYNNEGDLNTNLIGNPQDSKDFFPPNSFYLQCHIDNDRIKFTLNKVIAVRLLNNVALKSTLTVRKNIILIEEIVSTISNNIWSHLQTLGMKDYECGLLKSCCDAHNDELFSRGSYHHFTTNLKTLMFKWFYDQSICSNDELDFEHTISISSICSCSFKLSQRMLLEIGLMPAISHIACIIASSLASNDLFGLYSVSALIVTDDSTMFAISPFYSRHRRHILKKSIKSSFKLYKAKPVVFFGEQELMSCTALGDWEKSTQQILGKGSYKQALSTSYAVRFDIDATPQEDSYWSVYEYHGDLYEKVKLRTISKKSNMYDEPYQAIIVHTGDCLDQDGVTKRFFFNDSDVQTMGIRLVSSFQNEELYRRMWNTGMMPIGPKYHLKIMILPLPHLSAIKFEASFLMYNGYETELISESINIHERLMVKKVD
ncbi:hypothetical protein [Parasitella parasitica]|uniref:Uncharacterized protein n=1 Tax=Parasitella parasitica TaxID=35722 RepID=A0A0B7N652_9FUNG|nr:hypothetical protein [Parasitella parasitica]